MRRVGYEHTQRAPLHFVVLVPGVGMLVMGAVGSGPAWVPWVLGGTGLIMVLLSFCFQRLTVVGEQTALLLRFGPLPFFNHHIVYTRIREARVARSTLIDGWGIHYTVGRGWIWNLWGFDCVEVELDKGRLRIGTDDAAGLARFLEERIVESQA